MKTLVAAVVLAASVGCTGLMTDSGWGAGGGSGSYTTDHGTVSRGLAVLTRENRPYLVLLSAGGCATGVRGGRSASGTIQAPNNRTVEWSCNTRDGVNGKLVIDGKEFRLEDGGVVLVDLRRGGTVVEQAAIDMKLFEGAMVEEELEAIAASDERVARFLKACDSPK